MSVNFQIIQVTPDAEVAVINRTIQHFEDLRDSNLLDKAFYDGSVKTAEDMVTFACRPELLFFLVLDNERDLEVCAHFHLTNFMGRAAMVHFSVGSNYLGKVAIRMVKAILAKIFRMKRIDGTPLVTSLVGVTPVDNKLACRFIKAVGFEPQTIIKESCDFADGTFRDGLITIMETPNG